MVFSFIFIMVSEPPGYIEPFLFYGIVISLFLYFSRIPLRFILGRCLIVAPFIFMASLFYPLSSIIGSDFQGFGSYTQEYRIALSIFLKGMFAVILLTLLVSTERFHNLLLGLRKLKMPALLGTISALMYRYIFILTDEALKTSRARDSRTPGKLSMNRLKVYGNQSGMIFLRSMDRSQMIYNSMLSRGFNGEFTGLQEMAMNKKEVVFSVLVILILLAVRITGMSIFSFMSN